MTYLLPKKNAAGDRPARGADAPLADDWMEGFGVSAKRFMLESNANMRQQRETADVETDLLRRAAEGGAADILTGVVSENLPMGGPLVGDQVQARKMETDDALRFLRTNKKMRDMAFDALKADAEANPDRYEGIDLTRETVEQSVNERLQSEYQELLAIEQTVPEGRRFVTSLVGGFAGTFADARNAPWMLFGGGPGLLKTMAKGAALNMAAEATQMPSRFEMADRLNIEDPDVVSELAMAGVFGGAFEGIAHGIGRGVVGAAKATQYLRARSAVPSVTGDAVMDRQVVDAAEQAVTTGENPLEAVQREIDKMPKSEPPPPGREPLVLRPEERVMPFDEEVDGQIREMQAEIDRVQAETSRSKNPLIETLRKSDGGLKIRPDGRTGAALKAADINPRSFPGLFSRQGRGEFDNLPASDWEEMFPGIIDATGTARGADYLDVDGFEEILIRSANNDYDWLQPRKEIADLEAKVTELEAAKDRGRYEGPLADFAAGEQAEGGFYVDPVADGPNNWFEPADRLPWIESGVQRTLDENWPNLRLTQSERREIVSELDKHGGDAEYLIERVLEREVEFAELPPSRAQEYEEIPGFETEADARASEAGRGRAGEPGQDGGAEGGGRAGEGRATEQTGAGEQALIDGVEPVSATDRAIAQREAQRGAGNTAPMDDGLFDLGARDQMDWLDDTASAKADPVMSQQVATIREELEAKPELADTKVAVQDVDGNVRTVSLSEWSDDLDTFEKAIARIDLCGKGPS